MISIWSQWENLLQYQNQQKTPNHEPRWALPKDLWHLGTAEILVLVLGSRRGHSVTGFKTGQNSSNALEHIHSFLHAALCPCEPVCTEGVLRAVFWHDSLNANPLLDLLDLPFYTPGQRFPNFFLLHTHFQIYQLPAYPYQFIFNTLHANYYYIEN